jgi:DNA (cytosine-5)-methyltransferase 1
MAGRRREDDENLVPYAFDWQQTGSSDRAWVTRAGDYAQLSAQRVDAVVYGLNTNRGGNADMVLTEDASPPITGSHGNPGGVMLGQAVRRLTPTECERLQALPDGWTDFGPDSRRYAALGDAVTASVSEWIGRRLIAA